MLDVCISSRLIILNGRTLRDWKGKFTSYQYNGNSVIGYCLFSEEQLSKVLYFHVEDPVLRLSDHSKISVRLITKFQQNENKECPHQFPEQFKWEEISPLLFNEALKRGEIKSKLEGLSNISISEKSVINSAVKNFKDLLLSAASISLKKKMVNGKKSKNKKWFNSDLNKMRKTFDHKGKLLAKYPNDPFIKGSFFKYRKIYCKSFKFQCRKYKADLIEKLDNLFENDPKAYWSLLDVLKENKRYSLDSMPSHEELNDHFSNLNKLPLKFKERVQEIEEILIQSETNSSFSKLDYAITKEEIIKCIHSLKNKKSCGLDCIVNEMIKAGEDVLLPCIHKIFNAALQLGIYPAEWKKGYISPIFKSGERFDPSNYRASVLCLV